MINQDAVDQLRRLMELRDERDITKQAAENAEKEYRDAEADMYEILAENPLQGALKIDLGSPWGVTLFTPRETYYGRIIDPDAAAEYYEQRALLEEVSAPKFVMKRINEEVRDCLEQNKQPPPGVDYYARRGVTITRQKS